ncbi:MAG: hypothetical protein PW786_01900 [Arachidicoccus sp.]|nr:hypothetical protein [Arachidicoccus sp.]
MPRPDSVNNAQIIRTATAASKMPILQDSRAAEFTRVLHHEVGHWLIGKWVGFHPADVQIKLVREGNPGYQLYAHDGAGHWVAWGACTTWLYRKVSSLNDQIRYLANREALLLAGAVYENVHLNDVAEPGQKKDLSSDAVWRLCQGNATGSQDFKPYREIATLHVNLSIHEDETSAGGLQNALEANEVDDPFGEAIRCGFHDIVRLLVDHRRRTEVAAFVRDADEHAHVAWQEAVDPNNFVLEGTVLETLYAKHNLAELAHGDETFHRTAPSIAAVNKLRSVLSGSHEELLRRPGLVGETR